MAGPCGDELQWATIGIERYGAVKERVGFNHGPSGAGVIRHRQRTRTKAWPKIEFEKTTELM